MVGERVMVSWQTTFHPVGNEEHPIIRGIVASVLKVEGEKVFVKVDKPIDLEGWVDRRAVTPVGDRVRSHSFEGMPDYRGDSDTAPNELARGDHSHLLGKEMINLWSYTHLGHPGGPGVLDVGTRGGVEPLKVGYLVRVDRVDGNWIWTNDYYRGWVNVANFLPKDEALGYFDQLIEKHPSSTLYVYRATTKLFLEYSLSEALKDLKLALDLDPDNHLAYLERIDWAAATAESLEDFDAVLQDCDILHRLRPDEAIVDYYRACLFQNCREVLCEERGYFAAHCHVKAMDFYMDYLANCRQEAMPPHSPSRIKAFYDIGRNMFALGAYERSRHYHFQALKLVYPNWHIFQIDSFYPFECNDSSEHLMLAYARANWMAGDYGESLNSYRKAINVPAGEEHPFARLCYARHLATCPNEELCNGEQAVELATTAFAQEERRRKLSPPPWQYYDTVAAAYARSGDYKTAIEWIRSAEEKHPWTHEGVLPDDRFEPQLRLYETEQPYCEEPEHWLEFFRDEIFGH